MEDKRIQRTKELLRQALMELLAVRTLEQITVKAICDRAQISRITFYAHYPDKYELAEDIFNALIQAGTREYDALQARSNPQRDPILGYCNILDSIFSLYAQHSGFFRCLASTRNPYLTASFFRHAMDIAEGHAGHSPTLEAKFPIHSVMAFLCFGLGAFISESTLPLAESQENAKAVLRGILNSDVLLRRLPAAP